MKLKTCLIFLICSILYFVYGIKTVHAVENLYYLHQDHLGSTSLVTDSTGKAVSKQSYYPYGATRSQTSDVGSKKLERQYTGQISDTDETGLYYYNARYYNPQAAKFTQADTNNSNLNRYVYVGNNPTTLVDASGNQQTRFDDEGFVNKDPGGFGGVVLDIAKYIANIYVGAIERWNATPSWYRKAIHGDYSEMPPLGFRSRSDIREFEYKYGQILLFMRGEEGIRMAKAWEEFDESLSFQEQEKFWGERYSERYNEISKNPFIYINTYGYEKEQELDALGYTRFAQISGFVEIGVSDRDYRYRLATLEHEYTHALDSRKYQYQFLDLGLLYNPVETEINANFAVANLPWLPEDSRQIAISRINRFQELREEAFSNISILKYAKGNFWD